MTSTVAYYASVIRTMQSYGNPDGTLRRTILSQLGIGR